MPPVNRNQPIRAESSESRYSLMEFMREFPDDATCLEWLWRNRYSPDGVHADCPKCGVERAFKRWLVETGWRLINEPGSWADVIAEHGDERLVGEVKGYTGSNTGLDVDTMFGQLLRRMRPGGATTWAVIVPTRSLGAVLRVPFEVRRTLGIRVFEVHDDDGVVEHLV